MPQGSRQQSPLVPEIQQLNIELKNLRGLSLRPDIVNRPPNSWRRLENFDLYVPGSIRKSPTPLQYGGPVGVAMVTIAEYKQTDTSPVIWLGIGVDGNLWNINTNTIIGSLGVGPISQPVFTCLLPGTLIPYTFLVWQPSNAMAVGQTVAAYAANGIPYIFNVFTGGVTGATPPAWPYPTPGLTVTDGSIVWQNIGPLNQNLYVNNYLIIAIPGFQPLKYDGTGVVGGITPVGVSAPITPSRVFLANTAADNAGYQPVTGRYYAWTLWNPKTLHESAPSPIRGASFLNGFHGTLGTSYDSIQLSIPIASTLPLIGKGYDHIRIYATRDGGSQLFLVQTMYAPNTNNVCTDINGAAPLNILPSATGGMGLPGPQANVTAYLIQDGTRGNSGGTINPTPDSALVFPAPGLTDKFPPPPSRWGAVFQGSLVLQDDQNANSIDPSDPGDFESYSSIGEISLVNENDDDINCLVGGLNLLVIGTQRRVDSIQGNAASGYNKQPIDSLHGFLGHRVAFPLGSKIVGLMRQGFCAFDLNISFGATSGNIQLGYGDATLIGDDILPLLQTLNLGSNLYLHCIAVDNTNNQIYFVASDGNSLGLNNVIFVYTLGSNPGWSIRYLPTECFTVKEMIGNIPANANSTFIIASLNNGPMALLNSNFWGVTALSVGTTFLASKFNSGAPIALAETQALPIPETVGDPEFWDVDRVFRYFYIEGNDLSNFGYQWAVDSPSNAIFKPTTPIPMKPGRNLINDHGKQIVLKFTHNVATSAIPLISYIKISYTIGGRP